MDLRDYGNKLRVAGPAVEQVNAISAALERDLSQHSAIGGGSVRVTGAMIIGSVLLTLLVAGVGICFTERQWGFLGVPIFSALGLVLLFVLPFREIFAGFAMYQGDPSFLVRYEPQIAFGGLIVTMWQEARRKRDDTTKTGIG